MKFFLTITHIPLFLLFTGLKITTAQVRNPEDLEGKIEGRLTGTGNWHFEMINNLNENNRKYYPAMKATLLKALPIIIAPLSVNPPKGFDISPSLTAYEVNNKVISGNITLFCFSYAKNTDGTSGFHKQEEAHGSLHFYINNIHNFLPEDFKNECLDTGIPLFFFQPKTTKINDHVLMLNKNTKVIKKPDQSIMIPLTKKEYLTFLIKKFNESLKNGKDDLEKIKQDLQKEKKQLNDPQTIPELKKVLPQMIEMNKKGVVQMTTGLSKLERMINQFHKEINMESAIPVYVKKEPQSIPGDVNGTFYYPVTTPEDINSKSLYRINPNYYNPALLKTATQLIVLNYHYSNFCPLFERNALKKWLQQINVQQLASRIR